MAIYEDEYGMFSSIQVALGRLFYFLLQHGLYHVELVLFLAEKPGVGQGRQL